MEEKEVKKEIKSIDSIYQFQNELLNTISFYENE